MIACPGPAVIGVACCRREIGNSIGHVVFEQYLTALSDTALLPMAIPARGAHFRLADWANTIVGRIDGLILPGSPSNVAPARYGGDEAVEMVLDPERDATTLPLIRAAFEARLPILGICRGFQELNVALGGSLCPDVEASRGSVAHRARTDVPRSERYEPAHTVQLVEHGYLHGRMASGDAPAPVVEINSLHRQGIDAIANGLRPEAYSVDGLVEAASCMDEGRFVLGVQWHPEWRRSRQGLDDVILRDFEAACLARAGAFRWRPC
jgi:putative glutamine amidotransferase